MGYLLRLWLASAHQHSRRHAWNAQHALEFVREHLDELRQHGLPILQNPLCLWASGQLAMLRNQLMQPGDIVRVCYGLEIDFAAITTHGREITVLIQHIRHTARHSRREIPSRAAEYHN